MIDPVLNPLRLLNPNKLRVRSRRNSISGILFFHSGCAMAMISLIALNFSINVDLLVCLFVSSFFIMVIGYSNLMAKTVIDKKTGNVISHISRSNYQFTPEYFMISHVKWPDGMRNTEGLEGLQHVLPIASIGAVRFQCAKENSFLRFKEKPNDRFEYLLFFDIRSSNLKLCFFSSYDEQEARMVALEVVKFLKLSFEDEVSKVIS